MKSCVFLFIQRTVHFILKNAFLVTQHSTKKVKQPKPLGCQNLRIEVSESVYI